MTWIVEEDVDRVRTLVLNRPDRMNAVPPGGWADLTDVLRRFEQSDQRALVVTGAGGNFCSGADLESREDFGVADGARRMGIVGEAASTLRRLTKPTIAAVDGVAAGAGMNLALGCDLVIAGSDARFSEIFVRRGLSVDFGGTWLLPRIVGLQRAKELALTGRMVPAEEAVLIGLCLEVVESDELRSHVAALAGRLADGAPIAQMFTKQMMDRSFELSFEDAVEWEGQSQSICFTTSDFDEGVASFVERRSPRFEGR